MSLAVKATRSAVFMFGGALTSKLIGLVGTLLVVAFVSPREYGEATVAAILFATASVFSSLGIGQYVVVKSGGRRDLTFHATVYQLLLGALAVALIFALQGPLSRWMDAPAIHRYLPGMAFAVLLDRVGSIPERVLVREMRFAPVMLARVSGELTYNVVAVATAILGWGGMALVAGNVARSLVRAVAAAAPVDPRDWLTPCRLRLDATLDVLRFGAPLAVGMVAATIATKWDNLLVSAFFGPAVMGAYNIAYNVAGMASGIVVDQVSEVLVPTFRRASEDRRAAALLRGTTLVSLSAMPLALGLAAVAPTVVAAFIAPSWVGVAPMLSVLCVAAALSPVAALLVAYFQACARPQLVMNILILGAVAVLVTVATVGRVGPLWTCGAVLLCTIISVLGCAFALRAYDGVRVTALLATQAGPLLACVPMIGAVLLARLALDGVGLDQRHLRLAIEILAGGVAYVGAAFLVARPAARDLLGLLRAALRRES